MLEYLNEIEAQLILWLPTITSVLSILGASIGLIAKFKKSSKDNTVNTKKLEKKIDELEIKVDTLNVNLKAVTTENIALKRRINKTLTKIDHVYRTEDAEE